MTIRRLDEDDPSLRAAESWFLANGLPAVLPRAALLRRVWSRSAPALAGLAAMAVNSVIVVRLTGHRTIDINGRPNLNEGFALALLAVAFPGAALSGWAVARLGDRGRIVAGVLATALVAVGVAFGGPGPHMLARLAIWAGSVALILLLTASGAGSILGWAARSTLANLAEVGGMFVRALPVVLLTFLVFFNTYVWLMAAIISRERLWLAVGFLIAVAAMFLIAGTLDRVRPMLTAPGSDLITENTADLAGTPFEAVPTPPSSPPLSHRERLNVVFVVGMSQFGQVLTAAVLSGAIFFTFGLIIISPELLDAWTRNEGSHDGRLLGMTLPIPNPLIQTTLLLNAITFMYLSAKAVTDKEYRGAFIDPLITNLQQTLLARDRYRGIIGATGKGIRNAMSDNGNDVFGKRYGEVLLIRATSDGPTATVYNTYPLNDCPAELWDVLNAQAIAQENDAAAALLNGPRYWLMSHIAKKAGEPQPTKTFGGIDMIEQATVAMAQDGSGNNPAPYSVNKVDRRAVFTFDPGRPVFELVDPDGQRWVMQTYSQVVDKNLSMEDLPGLASRLNPPQGWHYETRTLTEPLVVDTTNRVATVMQDELTNTYSLQS